MFCLFCVLRHTKHEHSSKGENFFFHHPITILFIFRYSVCDEKVKKIIRPASTRLSSTLRAPLRPIITKLTIKSQSVPRLLILPCKCFGGDGTLDCQCQRSLPLRTWLIFDAGSQWVNKVSSSIQTEKVSASRENKQTY